MRLMGLIKPEYMLRPQQVLRRLRKPAPCTTVTLPWGMQLSVNTREDIGNAIYNLGVYDLPISEVLYRLTDSTDLACDAGANVGYMTAILAHRASEVLAFEPHPELFKRLTFNINRWHRKVAAFQIALSNENMKAALHLPSGFMGNEGRATLSGDGEEIIVEARRLDSFNQHITILKVDVEGHELELLQGAGDHIGRVRDILFEEHGSPPTPLTNFLLERGYHLFSIARTFWRAVLTPISQRVGSIAWLPNNYLATLDPKRALARTEHIGWRCLRSTD